MKNKKLDILFIGVIICSVFISSVILEALSYTESTYNNASIIANNYFTSLNDNGVYLTSGPDTCALNSGRIHCSGETDTSLISKIEFEIVGGKYLLDPTAYPYWLGDTSGDNAYEGTIKGVKTKSKTENSGVKPAVYIKENITLSGSGTWEVPFILEGPLIIQKYILTVDYDGGESNQIFAPNNEYEEGYPIPLQIPTKSNCTFTNWTLTGEGVLSSNGTQFTMGNTNATLKANYDCSYVLTMDLNGGTGTNKSGNYKEGAKVSLSNPTKNNCSSAANCSCTFKNWTLTGGGTLNSAGTEYIMGASSATLTANYNCSYLFPYVSKQRNTGPAGTETPSYTFNVTSTAKYKIELWGARGGMYGGSYIYGGAYTSGEIELSAGDILYIYVGGRGCDTWDDTGCANSYSNACSISEYFLLGGFNGGGNGHWAGCGLEWGGGHPGGGGATDIRFGNTSLDSRIMVAAGAGGANASSLSAAGGGLTNNDAGAFQTSGNAKGAGQQGDGGAYNCCYWWGRYPSPGSGGGYWGSYRNARGGSSYISGHTGCIAVNSSGSSICSENKVAAASYVGTTDRTCSIHYSGKEFINGTTLMIDGAGYNWTNKRGAQTQMPNTTGGKYTAGTGHNENGYAKITQLDT